jgi:ketosteroid isomerase-like protein
MSENTKTVQRYMDAYGRSDHAAVLSCLTDDVEWIVPGVFHLSGKTAFEAEIENPAFVGRPVITVTRLTEEHDVVIAEGSVRTTKKEGDVVNIAFCDVFEMQGMKVKRLISYLMVLGT